MSDPSVPLLRRPVAVLLSRFPLVTETFILREVIEMERQGQPVRLVPLLRERPATVHREAVPWMRTALHTPFLSPAILAANARALRRTPRLYGGLLGRVLLGTAASPNMLVRTLALFPKCVYLAERLRDEGIGHIHAHFATYPALAAFIVSRLTGIPYSVTVHAHDVFVRRTLLHEKLEAASFVRTVSRFNRHFLSGLYPDLADQLDVIHVGVDPDAHACAPPVDGAPRLLCVAALKPYKGLPVLVEACRRLRNDGVSFHCEIVGEGPERRALEAAILRARLQERVRLLGARPQHEVARLLDESSVFVLPSVVAADGQMEGIPVALMEAMASGRPVVASALSGIPELVEDGASGVLVPPGDPERLAEAIRSLLDDPERARRLGQHGRETIRREFRLDETVDRLLERIADNTAAPAGPLAVRLRCSTCWSAQALGIRRVREGRDATVVELLVPDGTRPRGVVAKIHLSFEGQSAPPAERARQEFEVLCRLQGVFSGQPEVAVPRPLQVDGDTVVMEPCPGTRLDELLRQARWARRDEQRAALVAGVRRAGLWLHVFQKTTPRQGSTGDVVERIAAAARADLMAGAVGAPGGSLARRLAHRVDSLEHRASASAVPLVARHGDFWPGNVLASQDRVYVIDHEAFGEGLPAEDLAVFLVQTELYCSYPGLAGTRAALRAAFLDGYGDSPDPATYELCRMAAGLGALRRSPAVGALRGWWRRRTLRRLLVAR